MPDETRKANLNKGPTKNCNRWPFVRAAGRCRTRRRWSMGNARRWLRASAAPGSLAALQTRPTGRLALPVSLPGPAIGNRAGNAVARAGCTCATASDDRGAPCALLRTGSKRLRPKLRKCTLLKRRADRTFSTLTAKKVEAPSWSPRWVKLWRPGTPSSF